jgi:hypothetical protein
MLSRSLHRSVFGCVCQCSGVCVGVPVGRPALRGVLGTRSVCADCHSRRSAGSMVQCRMCALVPPVLWGWRSGVCSGLGV